MCVRLCEFVSRERERERERERDIFSVNLFVCEFVLVVK